MSATTQVQIVANTSLSDGNGMSANSIMVKGPNVLSNQPEVLARWKNYDDTLCSHLTKAYHFIKTGELEMHIKRVVWRFGKTNEPWRYYRYKTVTFGDRPAGVYLNIVINKTAELFGSVDQMAVAKIKNDRYVDDPPLVDLWRKFRFKGNDINDCFESDGTMSQI